MNPRIDRPKNFALLVFTDGRFDCLTKTLDSFRRNMGFDLFDQRVIIDDSADPEYRERLLQAVESDFRVVSAERRRGFAGAVQAGWNEVKPWVDYIFHLEDDFVLEGEVDINDLADLMERESHITQVALLRQAWNEREREAGGIIQADPDDFHFLCDNDCDWIEHRKFWTTNPSLYPRWVTRRGWPQGDHSEGRFGVELFSQDPSRVSAFWGDGEPWVTHIGDERVGTGY